MADYKSETNEKKCIFCEFSKGNINLSGKFWEDENYMAFLSLYPNTEGFSVVMPKQHYGSDVLNMEDTKLQEFILVAKKVSNILMRGFEDVGRVGLMMEGTGVDHAHIKLFPMHDTKGLKNGTWKQTHSNTETFFPKYLGYMASNDGPKANEDDLVKLANKLRELSN